MYTKVVRITMDEMEDLVFSQEGAAVRYLLFQGYNDVNIFVEDVGKEYIYQSIFERMLKDTGVSIQAIFPAGGKTAVKQRYDEFGPIQNGIKNIYIVDGDFDRYINIDSMIHDDCFVYLKTYNIENYFIDEDATINYARGLLHMLKEQAIASIKFGWWKATIVRQLSELFLTFCLMQQELPSEKNVNMSHYKFINSKTGFAFDGNVIKDYCSSIQVGIPDAAKKLNAIRQKYETFNGQDYFNLICGKYLIDSLFAYIRQQAGRAIVKEDFVWHLIMNFDIAKLDYLKSVILSAAQIA